MIVVLATACSFDVENLRASGAPAPDGSVDYPTTPDSTVAGTGGTGTGGAPGTTGSDGGTGGQIGSGGSADGQAGSTWGTGGQVGGGAGTNPDGSEALPDLAPEDPDLAPEDDVVATDDGVSSPDVPADFEPSPSDDAAISDEVAVPPDLADTSEVADSGGFGGTGGVGTGGTNSGGADGGGAGGTSSAGGGAGGTRSDGGGGTGPDPNLVLWYKFDESSGPTAADSAMFGGTARNATLATIPGGGASATFSAPGRVGTHAVTLTPAMNTPTTSGGYITVPSLQTLAPGALTIAVWVNLTASTPTEDWERIFDFGTGTTANNYLYLVARAGAPATTPVQFVISTQGHKASYGQTINSQTALSTNEWHHIAIVLPLPSVGNTYAGKMYIDGQLEQTNTAMTLHASDIGPTTNNWLGRSQYTDSFFNGSLDDFRVYKRALSDQEIADLFALR